MPIVPGSGDIIKDPDEAMKIALKIGFPVVVKAAFGGGGKGMRVAHNEATLKHDVALAATEAQAAFGDGGVYLEKFLEGARHIEFSDSRRYPRPNNHLGRTRMQYSAPASEADRRNTRAGAQFGIARQNGEIGLARRAGH